MKAFEFYGSILTNHTLEEFWDMVGDIWMEVELMGDLDYIDEGTAIIYRISPEELKCLMHIDEIML